MVICKNRIGPNGHLFNQGMRMRVEMNEGDIELVKIQKLWPNLVELGYGARAFDDPHGAPRPGRYKRKSGAEDLLPS